MDTTSTLTNVLNSIFSYPFNIYKYVYNKLIGLYNLNSSLFSDVFFNNISNMDPKTLRMIAYQLFLSGITMETLYNNRTNKAIPDFLYKLEDFPSESLLVILKYKFPPFSDGNIFLKGSLDTPGKWLDFALDICRHLNIDINERNSEYGRTLLHDAVSYKSHSTILTLLCHGANPNVVDIDGYTPLNYALGYLNDTEIIPTIGVSFNIIKQLRRYGAKIDPASKNYIQQSNYRSELENLLYSGEKLQAYYCDLHEHVFSLDSLEDINLIMQVDSNIRDSNEIQNEFPNINLNMLNNSLENQNKETIKNKDNKVLSWPYYINDTETQTTICSIIDDTITTESPPGSDEVYAIVTRNLFNVPEKRTIEIVQSDISKVEHDSIPTTPDNKIETYPMPQSVTLFNPHFPTLSIKE